jgi:hypothetical protein
MHPRAYDASGKVSILHGLAESTVNHDRAAFVKAIRRCAMRMVDPITAATPAGALSVDLSHRACAPSGVDIACAPAYDAAQVNSDSQPERSEHIPA